MSERESSSPTEWWGVYRVNTLIAVFATKDAAREWLAWNSGVSPEMHINPVRSIRAEENPLTRTGN